MRAVLVSILFSFLLLSNLQATDINSETTKVTSKLNNTNAEQDIKQKRDFADLIRNFYHTTGVYAFTNPQENKLDSHGNVISKFSQSYGRIIMILIAMLLFYLAIAKGFEPLLLIPIGFGGLLANIPLADIAGEHGFIGVIYNMGISNELFPILIFMGVGAMTDFGPLLANPKTAFLGGAAQFGIFGTLAGAAVLSQYGIFDFTLKEAAAISIIGGADGPTSIFIASKLAPDMLGAIAVSAYSYMALVPVHTTTNYEGLNNKKRETNNNDFSKSCIEA